MGRTPFQAALLTRKLQLGIAGAVCDEDQGVQVGTLARSAIEGHVDAAVQRVLTSASATLDSLIILDEMSNEVQTAMRALLAQQEALAHSKSC